MARLFDTLTRALAPREKALSSVDPGKGGWFRILEPWAGAWQGGVTVDFNSVLANHAVFACQTLIASDIAKLRVKLVSRGSDNVWQETTSAAYSPVLRKPNHYQTRIQFFESWLLSKLQTGNTVLLKQRDNRGVVVRLYALDWARVKPMIADNGDVFYELNTDNMAGIATLAGVNKRVLVPAREVIHDRFNCLFHPLVGVSPIFAAGLSATHGLSIQEQATKFFQNGARPGGILTAPDAIKDETAARLKKHWEENFSGANAGKVAVLGDGLKYEALTAKSNDSQLIEQLKWTAEQVCGVYHVPAFMVGVGQEPNYNNVQNLTLRYYSQCLQVLMESIEVCLDEGLGLGENIGTEFDLDGLLRMDSTAQMEVLKTAVGSGVMTPNEARNKLDLTPQEGGDVIYLQQQQFSLAALAKRDAKDDPFAKEAPAALPAPDPAESDKHLAAAIEKRWEAQIAA